MAISDDEFNESISNFIGLIVARVWFSDHRVMYMEVGDLIGYDKYGRSEHAKRIFTGYDWRIIRGDGSELGRRDKDADTIAAHIMEGHGIEHICLSKERELQVDLGVLVVQSQSDADGPDWHLCENPWTSSYLSIEYGVMVREIGDGPITKRIGFS